MAPEIAAPLACSGLTTYSALKKVQDTLAKSPVVIIGVGGLGLMAVGLVKAMGLATRCGGFRPRQTRSRP